ncbi:MAG: hypothetical protein JWO42_1609 [Chloroflexi bacterium]|nr:hypothetical protein [Chloroflexota bacterium]
MALVECRPGVHVVQILASSPMLRRQYRLQDLNQLAHSLPFYVVRSLPGVHRSQLQARATVVAIPHFS